MIEFTGHIQVDPIDSSSASGITSGSFDFMAEQFDFQPVVSDDPYGVCYICDKTFIIDLPGSQVLQYFSIPRSCVVTLYSNKGDSYDIGTKNIPASVLISRHLNRAQLQIHCRMLRNPLW